jgi:transcriptional/translational regulatory protein YebC/TACO1
LNHEIRTSINDFNHVREKLEELLGVPEQADLIWQPENYVVVDEEKRAVSLLKLIDTLDNCDDVQNVYGNFDINDNFLKEIV